METLHVRDFGVVGDGQSDDGPAIRKALAAAGRFGHPVVVRFEPKTYRIGPRYDCWCALVLERVKDIALDGQGCTLLLHPDNRALLLYRCENVAYGVNATNSPRFGEGPVPYDQVYKNNRFEDCWIGGIVTGRLALEPKSPPSGGPILIEGNTFVQGPGHGVEAFRLRDVAIRNCKFVMRPDAAPHYRAVRLNACKAVTVRDCEIDDSRQTVQDVIQIENMRAGDAMFVHNTFRLFGATPHR